MSLSVVIPAFDEAGRLPATLRRILDYFRGRSHDLEIIVSDDGSRDETVALARSILGRECEHPWSVLRTERNMGKGNATRRGVLAARGDRVLFSDADLSTPIEDVEKLERALDAGSEAAIGSRGLPSSRVQRRQPFYREGMGRIFNLIMRVLILPGYCDTQCGFKLFTRRFVREIFPRSTIDGWAFDVELLLLARRMGLTVTEVPVRWVNSRASKVGLLRGPLEMLRDLARIRCRWLLSPSLFRGEESR